MPPLSHKLEPEELSSSPSLEGREDLNPAPVLRLHLDELSHPASLFASSIDLTRLLPNAISQIIKHLYVPLQTSKPSSKIHIPPTRSVTLILRSMDGVAYTTGIPLDSHHKEIHLSLNYASRFLDNPIRFRSELIGVITHEMVHAYQWDAQGSCPGGLIEGIADYVRLKAGLAPPHWKREEVSEEWDAGYQKTAYFLKYLEGEYGTGTVARINARLSGEKYQEEGFWTGIFGEGRDVHSLFKRYRDSLKGEGEVDGEKMKAKGEEGVPVMTGCLLNWRMPRKRLLERGTKRKKMGLH